MGKDWGERIRTLGALVALLGAVGALLLALFNALPVASASEVAILRIRVDAVENGFKDVRLKQTENQELALMQRLDTLTDKLERMGATAPDYASIRGDRVDVQQRLRAIRGELAVMRGTPP